MIHQTMSKNILLTILFLAVSLTVSAIPAKRMWKTMCQPDGTQVDLMLVGDEHQHYFITTDGMPVMEEGSRYFFARATEDALVPSDIQARNVSERNTADKERLLDMQTTWTSRRQKIRSQAVAQVFPNKVGTRKAKYTGKKKGLVILVAFNDKDFATPKSTFEKMANQEGYTENGAIGSVHDYFYDNSYGKFDLTFDVVGPYKASKSWAWYGENFGGSDQAHRVSELIQFAMKEAGKEVNYKDYDWDGDGEVDQVYIIYAGYAESSGADSRTIWPHESSFGGVVEWGGETYDLRLKINGMYLNTYACGSELRGTEGTEVDGIGTMCHEFSHCLGLPDFYDTAANGKGLTGNYGMDMWDVMDAGAYNGDSNIPMAYSGYERHFCGWLNYKELTEPCKVSNMKPLGNGGDVYRITNPGNKDEYYLLEYRNGGYKWDKGMSSKYIGLTASGLMVTHVTYNAQRWEANTVNRTGAGYQCMTIFHADNSEKTTFQEGGVTYIDTYEYTGDLYPSNNSSNKELTDTSTPAATLNTKNSDGTLLMHRPVTNITKKIGSMSFTFMDGTEEYTSDLKGIIQTTTPRADNRIFTLNGQYAGTTLETLPKGIYLQNGKKLIVR